MQIRRDPSTKKLGKLDQRWIEVVWTGKAKGSDEHIGLDHRGARRFRAVRRESQISLGRSDSRRCWIPLRHKARWSHFTA